MVEDLGVRVLVSVVLAAECCRWMLRFGEEEFRDCGLSIREWDLGDKASMPRWSRATAWCDHYDAVQSCAVVLLYIQVNFNFVWTTSGAMSFSCCDSRAIRASELRSEWVTPIQAATLGQDSVSVFTWQPSHWAFECLPADVNSMYYLLHVLEYAYSKGVPVFPLCFSHSEIWLSDTMEIRCNWSTCTVLQQFHIITLTRTDLAKLLPHKHTGPLCVPNISYLNWSASAPFIWWRVHLGLMEGREYGEAGRVWILDCLYSLT